MSELVVRRGLIGGGYNLNREETLVERPIVLRQIGEKIASCRIDRGWSFGIPGKGGFLQEWGKDEFSGERSTD